MYLENKFWNTDWVALCRFSSTHSATNQVELMLKIILCISNTWVCASVQFRPFSTPVYTALYHSVHHQHLCTSVPLHSYQQQHFNCQSCRFLFECKHWEIKLFDMKSAEAHYAATALSVFTVGLLDLSAQHYPLPVCKAMYQGETGRSPLSWEYTGAASTHPLLQEMENKDLKLCCPIPYSKSTISLIWDPNTYIKNSERGQQPDVLRQALQLVGGQDQLGQVRLLPPAVRSTEGEVLVGFLGGVQVDPPHVLGHCKPKHRAQPDAPHSAQTPVFSDIYTVSQNTHTRWLLQSRFPEVGNPKRS